MTVNRQHLWPTTIYTFKIEDGIDNEILYLEILEKEKKNQRPQQQHWTKPALCRSRSVPAP